MDLKAEITEMAVSLLTKPDLFLVDTVISGNKVQKKIVVIVDGDQGVTIEDCASISRGLSAKLDEKSLIEENYTLEVTTPGVDMPLQLRRQYLKNVGRSLKVTLADKSIVKGKLTQVTELNIVLAVEEKEKKKKSEEKKVELPFNSIDKALVQISFK